MSKSEDLEEEVSHSNHPEVIGVVLMVISLLIFLCLISFNQNTPSQNWLGALGHFTAFALLYTFGILSYPLNLFLIWLGWKKLSHNPINKKLTLQSTSRS